MARHDGRHKRLSIAVVTLIALLLGSPAPAAPNTRSTTARGADTQSWCAAVIAINTKYGAMKNKTFIASRTAFRFKDFVDAMAESRSRFIALAPASMKTAVSHQMAYFVRLKANHYSQRTPVAPWTLAEVKKIVNFEKSQCGIKFP